MDRPKRQTATATPAKPGGLPLTLEGAAFVMMKLPLGAVELPHGAIGSLSS